MPRAGLSEATLAMFRAAVADPDGGVVARFRAKLRQVPGSSCVWWSGAVSARGHGRFWLGSAGGRDVVMIAHRFAFALAFGVDALVPVLGHRCDNPLCQNTGPGHVQLSSHLLNRHEWAARRHTVGNPLRDTRGARGRVRALRDVVRRDPTAADLQLAISAGMVFDEAQLPLWQGSPVLAGGDVILQRAPSDSVWRLVLR